MERTIDISENYLSMDDVVNDVVTRGEEIIIPRVVKKIVKVPNNET